MQIPKKIKEELESQAKDLGIMAVTKGSRVNYRTIKKAIETGECTTKVFKNISKFLVKSKKEIAKIENDLN